MIKIDSEEINDRWCQELRISTIGISKGGVGSGIKGHTTQKEDKAHSIIRSFEERIINEPIEHSLFVDGDGEVILQKSGVERHVTFLEDELWDIKLASNVVFTHNHPKSFVGPFSLNDVRFIAKQEIKEGRVVSGNKLYIIKLKGKISPDLIQEKYQKAYEAEYFKCSMKVTSGELTNKEGNDMLFDRVWTDVAKKTPQLTYRKESAFQKGGVGSGIKGHKTVKGKKYKNILSFENQVRNEKKENGLLCDKDGNVLLVLEGTEDTILFSASEKEFLFYKAKGGIFTHNHPLGNGFSKADILTSMTAKLQEIRAVGKEYTYSMKFKKDIPAHIRDEFPHRYEEIFDESYITFMHKISNGMSNRKAQQLCFHEMTQRYSEEYSEYFTYERTKSFSKGGVGSGIKGHRTHKADKTHEIIRKYEDKIRGEPIEHAMFIDGDGKVILQKDGTRERISFTSSETKKISWANGVILTHNHPNDSSISVNDINASWKLGIMETRAVGKHNLSVLKFKKKIPKEIFDKIQISMNMYREKFYAEFTGKARRFEISAYNATIAYSYGWLAAVVKDYPEWLEHKRISNIEKGGIGSGIRGHRTAEEQKSRLYKVVEDFEEKYRNRVSEIGLTVDKEGNVLLIKKGTKTSIKYTPEEWDILSSEKSHLFTHNHGNDATLSPADFDLMWKAGLKETRAVGPTNTFILTFKKKIPEKIFYKMLHSITYKDEVFYHKYTSKVKKGEMKADIATIAYADESMETFVEEFPEYLSYEKITTIKKGGVGSGIKGHKTERNKKKRKIYKMIRDFENRVRGEPLESCLVVDGEGKVLISKQGTEDSIHFTENERYNCIEGAKKGKVIFTHNHPSSSSFSLNDILTANALNYSEMRIAGKKHDYVMKFSKTLNESEVINSHSTQNKHFYEKFDSLVVSKKLDGNKAWMTHTHLIWKHVAEEIDGLEYKRTR